MQQIDRLNEQVNQLYDQGQYEQAIDLANKCLTLTYQILGQQHPDVAEQQNRLAFLYKLVGNYKQAEFFYCQAMEIKRVTLGEKHPLYAKSLNNLALLYEAKGDFKNAEPLLSKTVEIFQKVVGKQHPSYSSSLNNLAYLYQSMGKFEKAETLYLEVMEIRRTVLGKQHPDFASSLNNLATLYQSMGKFEKAEPLLLEATEIDYNLLGKNHPEYATDLNNVASFYRAKGDFAKAKTFYYQAREIICSVFGQQHPYFALISDNLAGVYKEIGSYEKAETLYCEAMEIRRKTLGKKHPDFAKSLNNLATFYLTIGNFAKAEILYTQAMEAMHISLGKEHPDVANSLINLATFYLTKGNFVKAELLAEKAIKSLRNTVGEQHPLFAITLNSLASLYQSMGNFAKAELLFRQAIETFCVVFSDQHPLYANILSNLAHLYYSMSDLVKAELLYNKALEVTQAALGAQHPSFAFILTNMSLLYSRTGEHEKAETVANQAVTILRGSLGEQHSRFALSLNNLAGLYYKAGKYEKVEPLLQQARKIYQNVLKEHPETISNLNSLAAIYVATNRILKGFKLMEQAKVIENKIIGQVFSISSESQRAGYLENTQWDTYLSLVSQYLFNSFDTVRSAFNLILKRKAIQAEVLASQRDLVLGGRYPELEPTLRKVMVIRNQIAQRILAGTGKEGLEDHQQFLAEWNLEKEKLETELAKQIPEIHLEQKFREVDYQKIATAMSENSILVEFVRFNAFDFKAVPARGEQEWKPARYLAFTLVAREPDSIQMIDLGEAEPIDNLIAAFRTSITGEFENQSSRNLRLINESPQNEHSSIGVKLREIIFDPLISAIGNHQCLLLSPDGDLTRLPFEVLPINDKYLIDLYEISYLAAGRDLLRFGIKSNRRTADPLVIADPDFDFSDANRIDTSKSTVTLDLILTTENRGHLSRDFNRSGLVFTRLEGTKEEGETIASMLGVGPLLESEALESRLKTCKSPRILHIATHGFFLPDQRRDPNQENRAFGMMGFDAIGGKGGINRLTAINTENPLLRSGLALAGANTWMKNQDLPAEAEDGILTAEDVTGLDLLDTELVVLSACETGLGEVKAGEGVFGLRRAFVLAGAKTLVMSLWKVPDTETQEIMTSFYEKILRGEPRGEALRQAQLEMKAKKPNPFFWGAFICQGETSPLEINAKENSL